MQNKNCNKCKIDKPINEFNKENNGLYGVRGNCKSCDKIRTKKYNDANREIIQKKSRNKYANLLPEEKHNYIQKKSKQNTRRFKTNPEALERKRAYDKSDKGIFIRYKNDATRRNRNYEFNLTFEQFSELINKECQYCPTTPSRGVDRINNSLGYIISNCAPCCSKCNVMKMNKSLEEFYSQIEKIYHKKNQKLSKV